MQNDAPQFRTTFLFSRTGNDQMDPFVGVRSAIKIARWISSPEARVLGSS